MPRAPRRPRDGCHRRECPRRADCGCPHNARPTLDGGRASALAIQPVKTFVQRCAAAWRPPDNRAEPSVAARSSASHRPPSRQSLAASVRCEPLDELRRHWRRSVGGTFQPGDLAALPVDDQARRNATGVHDADRGALGDQEYRQPGDFVLLKEGQPAVVPQILTQNALLSELDRGQYNVFAKRH